LGQRVVFVVVNAGGVDVGDLLVKPPLAGADILDAAGQLLEVIVSDIGIFEAVVVEDEALADEFFELVRRLLAEARGCLAAHPETECQHHVEVVVRDLVGFAVGGSGSVKPNN